MVHRDIWDSYSDEECTKLRAALALISGLELLPKIIRQDLTRVVEGAAGLTNEQLSESIQRHQAESLGLSMLHSFGLSLTQDS
jgi:hypothetical protein